MKIQCDVCDKDEASVFCVADEAALCAACDHRVHHANKLAGKHHRFSLLEDSDKQVPKCDICQDKRAFLFCQQDRAILCKECDVSIHKTNEHTQKHTRFLLTGVKLSATSALYTDSSSSDNLSRNVSDDVPNMKNKPVSIPTSVKTTVADAPCDKSSNLINGSISSSSISEYLMETLPGWHVEDFLDSSSSDGFCKTGENDGLPFFDISDLGSNNLSGNFGSENMGFWVPQAQHQSYETSAFGTPNGMKEFSGVNYNIKSSRKWCEDDSFAVPQISPQSNANKRGRNFW